MRRSDYDTPAVAMVEALNACVGRCVHMAYLRDEFRFRLGGEPKMGQFSFWLFKVLSVPEVAESAEIVNIKRPGQHIDVWIKVANPIALV